MKILIKKWLILLILDFLVKIVNSKNIFFLKITTNNKESNSKKCIFLIFYST